MRWATRPATLIFRCAGPSELHRAGCVAKHFYGNTNAWKRILDANRGRLSDPDRIRSGRVLKISAKS